MSAQRTKVKAIADHTQDLVCPACGETLSAPDVPKAKTYRPISARQIIMSGLLMALDDGPGTPRELEERMGVKPSGTETTSLLRTLERKKEVRIIGTRPARTDTGGGQPTFVWERCFKAPAL